ncbi:uncharacterized protein [Rutidosis leptorrhynchoides]|uniref:uncharacterized protein n=1 Tax=Rutidosis leptorrhynchoides TaxID=125765 RepID=UPI003A98E486
MDGEEEGNPHGNPPPVVNEVVANDPNDTPMWNVRMVAQTVVPPAITKPPIEAENWKIEDVTKDAFKLRAFPFTLDGEAKAWLRNLPSDSIRGDESLYDAWVRFKKLLRACPPHGLTKKEYINTFYRGTNFQTKQYLDSSSGGVFMYNSPKAAEKLLEDIAINTYKWAPSPRDLARKNVAQVESEDGQVTLASLNNQFQLYGKELKKIQQTLVAMQVGCQRCEGPHLTKNCPQVNQCTHIDLDDIPMNSEAHVNFVSNQNFQRGGTSNQGNNSFQSNNSYYNPNQKQVESTEAFLLKENEFLKQQIRHNQASFQNFESTIGRLSSQVAERSQGTLPSNTQVNPSTNYNTNRNNPNQNNNNTTRVILIESNTTNQNSNQPSSSNPNKNYAQVNSISSMAKEKEIESLRVFAIDLDEGEFDLDGALDMDTMDLGVFKFLDDSEEAEFIPYQVKSVMTMEATNLICKDLEGELKKVKLGDSEQRDKVESILDMKAQSMKVEVLTSSFEGSKETPISQPQPLPPTHLKNVDCKLTQDETHNIYVKLPLAEVLENMPNYGKFLKALMAKKGEVEQASTTFLLKECDGILRKQNLPTKMGDPGPFLIPCKVNWSEPFTSLADSGASINFMPLSIYKKLGLGDFHPPKWE